MSRHSGVLWVYHEETGMTPRILIIYTGGTIGMMADPEQNGVLRNVDFSRIEQELPALRRYGYHLQHRSFDPVIDSSDIRPADWIRIARIIADEYEHFDGFVILHGTDTMAWTASALSFLLEGLEKPVILTGSQIPIGVIRTDGRENLITSVEIAAARYGEGAAVPEVCIYFESMLYRGNRTVKQSAEHFNAFASPNFRPLAEAGINISYDRQAIRYPDRIGVFGPGGASSAGQVPLAGGFRPTFCLDDQVLLVKLFPGISSAYLDRVLSIEGLKGAVIETYGSGNAPQSGDFVSALRRARERGLVLLNVSQCIKGSVNMALYETGAGLGRLGMVNGHDMTSEAALTKMMYLFGRGYGPEDLGARLGRSLRGELTEQA